MLRFIFQYREWAVLIRCGEGGIRTRGRLPYARLASEYHRPLGHLSFWGAETSRMSLECKPGVLRKSLSASEIVNLGVQAGMFAEI